MAESSSIVYVYHNLLSIYQLIDIAIVSYFDYCNSFCMEHGSADVSGILISFPLDIYQVAE